eukprot:1114353-Alexandrium_andersonii.AAC.1
MPAFSSAYEATSEAANSSSFNWATNFLRRSLLPFSPCCASGAPRGFGWTRIVGQALMGAGPHADKRNGLVFARGSKGDNLCGRTGASGSTKLNAKPDAW